MGSQSRWGLTIPLTGLPLADQKELVASLPDLGYTDAWSAELNGVDAFTPLTLASQWAPQLRLGMAFALAEMKVVLAWCIVVGNHGTDDGSHDGQPVASGLRGRMAGAWHGRPFRDLRRRRCLPAISL